MDDIQYLAVGERIRLAGGVLAVVEDNPHDGVWLLARFSREPVVARRAKASMHGMTVLSDPASPDVVAVVNAGDILERYGS